METQWHAFITSRLWFHVGQGKWVGHVVTVESEWPRVAAAGGGVSEDESPTVVTTDSTSIAIESEPSASVARNDSCSVDLVAGCDADEADALTGETCDVTVGVGV